METDYTPHTNAPQDAYLLSILRVRQFIYNRFSITTLHVSGDAIRFEATALRAPWRDIKKESRQMDYNAYKQQWGGRIIVTLVKIRKQRTPDEKKEMRAAWLLFIATICTTLMAGYLMSGDSAKTWWGAALNTVSFSAGPGRQHLYQGQGTGQGLVGTG